LRRIAVLAAFAAAVVAALATAAASSAAPIGPPQADPAGILNLPAGFGYTILATPCVTQEQSTESGLTFPMPDDPDGKALFRGPRGEAWLIVHHELTQPRPGDFQGDVGKCAVPEQTPGDSDSDGFGSVSRLTLAKNGTTVTKAELITTGLHDLCAATITPWNTYLTNEEFPFIVDPPKPPDGEQGSGWVWEIDPATGAQTKLIGMGRFSHEQETYASGAWYLTDDRGDARFIYRFVPDRNRDLTAGSLFGLAFDKVSGTGTWVGPLNYKDPDTDMRARGYNPAQFGFVKAEGMVSSGSQNGIGGGAIYFSESGAGTDPGRIWTIDHLGNDPFVTGHVVVEGDFARLGRPDNIRFTDAGDLFINEDHSSSDFARGPTGNVNQMWVLPRGQEGAENLILFGVTPDEPTGPWFSFDNKLMYLSIQADPPRRSFVIAIRHPANFNQPYDR
jgi:secreted PhoX family phosphatase